MPTRERQEGSDMGHLAEWIALAVLSVVFAWLAARIAVRFYDRRRGDE